MGTLIKGHYIQEASRAGVVLVLVSLHLLEETWVMNNTGSGGKVS